MDYAYISINDVDCARISRYDDLHYEIDIIHDRWLLSRITRGTVPIVIVRQVPPPKRSNIAEILTRLGMSEYDEFEIAMRVGHLHHKYEGVKIRSFLNDKYFPMKGDYLERWKDKSSILNYYEKTGSARKFNEPYITEFEPKFIL